MINSVIITGNKGLIGSFLEDFLLKQNYEVIGIDKEINLSLEKNVKDFMKSNKDSFHLINAFALNDHIKKKRETYDPLKSPLSNFQDYMNINLTSLYSVCRQFILTRKQGSIINFSSIYGLLSPDPNIYNKNAKKEIGYPVSKTGVISLSNYFAANYAPNFRVNTLALGGISNKQDEVFIKNYSKKVPLQRMMNISELLPAISFLLDRENTYITGTTLTIDGGYSII